MKCSYWKHKVGKYKFTVKEWECEHCGRIWQLLLSKKYPERYNMEAPKCDCKEKKMGDRSIWTFKYQPESIDDMILNADIKPKLKKAIEEVPNLMLYGTAGVGKGTFANIMIKETGYDHMWLNASDETGIDIVREKISPFATSMPMTKMQLVILNESDSLTSTSKQNAQKMLKQLMEDVYKVTRFIYLTNNINEMIPELQSRCTLINICNPPIKEIGKLALIIVASSP